MGKIKKRKTIQKLEGILEALVSSKPIVSHNYVETDLINDKIIGYQREYKKITGRYYDVYHKRKK